MNEIYRRLKKNPRLFIHLLIASLFVNLLALATPIFVILVLQRYIAHGASSTLLTLLVGILIIIIFEFFFRNIRHKMAGELEIENAIISDSIFKKINTISTSNYELNGKARPDLIMRSMQSVNQVFNANTALVIIDTPFILVFLAALVLLHYQLAFITILFIAIQIIISSFLFTRFNSHQSKLQRLILDKSMIISEVSNKYITIRYFKFLKLINLRWKNILSKFLEINDNVEISKNMISSFIYSLTLLLTVAIISWGSMLVIEGSLTVGALIGANILASRCLGPISKLIYNIEPLKRGEEALKNLEKMFDIKSESYFQTTIKQLSGKVKLNNLSFKYPLSKEVLFKSISTEIAQGDVVLIKGDNYSGKTTLLKIIAGIIEVEEGCLYFDDVEISKIPISTIRENLFYIPQKISLINSSILTNIINDSEIKKDQFMTILNDADLTEYVNSLPDGINSIIDDIDNNIALKYRKRIAIARSIFLGGNIIILDDPLHGADSDYV